MNYFEKALDVIAVYENSNRKGLEGASIDRERNRAISKAYQIIYGELNKALILKMNQGWSCPKCGSVYSPKIEKCLPCSTKITRPIYPQPMPYYDKEYHTGPTFISDWEVPLPAWALYKYKLGNS